MSLRKPGAGALIDALPASMRKEATRDFGINNNLTRVRGSLALSRSYEDSHIDANSLVRDNREWLRVRVDAFYAFFFCTLLHVENVSAGRQRDAIVSRLVCSQPRDFFLFLLTQDDQWILGISFGRHRRLRHVIRFNRPNYDNLQMPLHETLRRSFNGCSAGQH